MEGMPHLDAFSHGFFQDILTLMEVLEKSTITKEEIEGYLIPNSKEKLMKKMGWELKKPCKGCKDKKK